MENELKKIMSSKSDEELIKIVTIERDDYQSLAIEIVEEEIRRRNIPASMIEKLKEDVMKKEKYKVKIESNTVSKGIRFIHFIVDSFIWFIVSFILTLPLNATKTRDMLLGYIIMFLVYVFYYALFELKWQKTVGKMITKTKVVSYSEQKPSNTDIVVRTFSRLVPFDVISYVFVRNGIHDILSKTKVIKDNKQNISENISNSKTE